MRQYFTYVNFVAAGSKHPIDYHFKTNFGDLVFEMDCCVAQGSTSSPKDGRILGYIEAEDQNGSTASEVITAILRTYAHVLETVEQAKDKVERWTGRTDITISGENVVLPTVDPFNYGA